MPLKFCALATSDVRALQRLAPDANGQPPERHTSDGNGNPCRHCLGEIPAGAAMLVLGYRPFPSAQPYAETGPLFLCADPCDRYPEDGGVPELYRARDMLLRGYDANHRIIYGTGVHAEGKTIETVASRIFEDASVAYVHMRSTMDTCYHCRIERG